MENIQVGDVVMWYEENKKKIGQIFGISEDMADIYCEKECAVYKKPLNQLKKLS